MEGPMRVHEVLARRELGSGGARLDLVEAAEGGLARRGRTVVVAVDDVALVRLLLLLPHAVDVRGAALRATVLDDGEQLRLRAVASEHVLRARRAETELATLLAVAGEREEALVLVDG